MADAIKSYNPASWQEEMAAMEEAEDSQIIGIYHRVRILPQVNVFL